MLELRKLFVHAFLACAVAAPAAAQQTPAGLKVAFTGDQSLGEDPEEVLRLVEAEGAEVLFIQGDFDYADDPAAWEAMLDATLGPDFPVIALVGNHDEAQWYGAGGYQDRLAKRMQRTGVPWVGELGVQATVSYKGLFVVQTAAGVFDDGYDHAAFIKSSLAGDASIWSISAWHKLMSDMQVGGKGDETGWEVYEESRRGGAIIATAHEHSYSRTHLMSSMEGLTVASTAQPLALAADATGTATDEGRSFAFVSGLGGSSIRDQERTGDWWASVYTSTQGANDGALFAVFHVDGDPRLARFYFKDVTGKVVDDFLVQSTLGQAGAPPPSSTTTTTTTTIPATTSTTTTTTTTVPAASSTSTTTTTTTAPVATSTTTTTSPAASSTTTTTPATATTSPSTSTTTTTAPPAPPPAPGSACADGADNDGDGRIDYPDDRGCDSPDDPYEQGRRRTRRMIRSQALELPPPQTAPLGACWDGIDNDADNRTDYPKDRGCDAPDDPSELNPNQTRRALEGGD